MDTKQAPPSPLTVRFVNFPEAGTLGTFPTLAAAERRCELAGYEAAIECDGRLVASWSIFRGLEVEA